MFAKGSSTTTKMFTAAFFLCIGFVTIGATAINDPTEDINQPAENVTKETVNRKAGYLQNLLLKKFIVEENCRTGWHKN